MGARPEDSTTEQEPADEEEPGAARMERRPGTRDPRARDSKWLEPHAEGVEPSGKAARDRPVNDPSRAQTRERSVPWWASVAEEAPPIDPAQALADFYDRRAPAALAYCARICEPESIADAVEEAFGTVFERAAMSPERLDDDELDRLLRDGVREAAAGRAVRSRGRKDTKRRVEEAERAYDALCGDDAPALGRSLLGEMIDAEPFAWPEQSQAAPAVAAEPAVAAGHAAAPEPARRKRRLRLPRAVPGWRRQLAIV